MLIKLLSIKSEFLLSFEIFSQLWYFSSSWVCPSSRIHPLIRSTLREIDLFDDHGSGPISQKDELIFLDIKDFDFPERDRNPGIRRAWNHLIEQKSSLGVFVRRRFRYIEENCSDFLCSPQFDFLRRNVFLANKEKTKQIFLNRKDFHFLWEV